MRYTSNHESQGYASRREAGAALSGPETAQPASQPFSRRQRHRSTSPRATRLLLAGLLSLLLIATAVLAWGLYALLSGNSQSGNQGPRNSATFIAEHPQEAANEQQVLVLAQRYLTAFLHHDYTTMWSLLAPARRALWPDEQAFADFWQARFAHYTLQGFSLGLPSRLSRWVDPETMTSYSDALIVPVSLQLVPDATFSKEANLPPEDLHPASIYRNLPFIVQASTGQDGEQHWYVIAGGPADPEAPILPPPQPAARSVAVPILMYHHVSPAPTHNLLDYSLTVTPRNFAAQLDYLKSHDYHTITFNQLFNALYFDAPLPPHPIILTFDDGYEDVYRYAVPILQAHGFSGMFYIITGVVGNAGYMSWGEIRDLLAQGMQVGSHTVHHISLGWVVIGDPQLTQQELQLSQATLQQHLGIPIQQFCYPSGEPFRHGTPLEQARITAMLAADGYVGATTDPGLTGWLQQSTRPFALLRIRVDGRENLAEFIASLPAFS
ncbi:MAG: polysaccharide deacetylase family protein [Thermogemmatispora sp.]|uniref:polysaccharide deacetylase family protein n=1 Tax=Thermogemmatispora sp. TaxID=1968838 RepID=UPI0026108896|nr:polysaccharide deacetylase family protein [Thermogemmatispora sp.]MBX5456297.1 polysaccharide deacetylase family protein [Thermogemmatispora sp.]